jgi:hypothetical protein
MKKTLSVLVVLMVFSSVVFARRLDNPGASSSAAVVKIGSTFKLYYKGSEEADVKISIRNGSNDVVYSETLKNVEGFVRPYNFSKLPEGEYTIQISDKFGRQIEKITYKQEKTEALAHLLKVAGTEAKYLLTVSNRGESDVTVKIYDGANNVIYNQTEIVSSDFARIYNLGRIGGDFTFEISDAKGTTSLQR